MAPQERIGAIDPQRQRIEGYLFDGRAHWTYHWLRGQYGDIDQLMVETAAKIGMSLSETAVTRPHRHGKHSQGVYRFDDNVYGEFVKDFSSPDQEFGNHWVLASLLGPNATTSLHMHNNEEFPMDELYIGIKGKLYVVMLDMKNGLVTGGKRVEVANKGILVPSGIPHFAYTETEGAVSIIALRHGLDVPEEDVHFPVSASFSVGEPVRIITPNDIRVQASQNAAFIKAA